MAAEVWLVAWLLGYPIGLAEAVMLNSLAVALRGAAFAVPAGIGVQEGGYIVVGALVGLPPDVMLAISLATRLGELIEGLPGLLAWQYAEGEVYWDPPAQGPHPPAVPLKNRNDLYRLCDFHNVTDVLSNNARSRVFRTISCQLRRSAQTVVATRRRGHRYWRRTVCDNDDRTCNGPCA